MDIEDKEISRKCIPVLKTEGWLLFYLYKLFWRAPLRFFHYFAVAMDKFVTLLEKFVNLFEKLWDIKKYINWCIVGSIFRMIVIICVPILFIYVLTLLKFDTEQHTNNSVLLTFGLFGLSLLWFIVFIWLSESNKSDINFVKKMIIEDVKKRE